MRKFESIVMSETEPVPDGTLWLKEKINTISTEESDNKPTGYDLWWFGAKGWQPLLDLDTRYNYSNTTLTGGVTITPVMTESTPDPEHGIVNIETAYSIYNGDRAIADNTNIVVETGLKKHVDDLQNQIDELVARVTTLESKVATLQSQVATNTANITSNANTIANHTSSITSLSNRVTALETT